MGLWRGERKCIDPRDLGRVASVNVIRYMGGSGAYQSAPRKEGQEGDVAIGQNHLHES